MIGVVLVGARAAGCGCQLLRWFWNVGHVVRLGDRGTGTGLSGGRRDEVEH